MHHDANCLLFGISRQQLERLQGRIHDAGKYALPYVAVHLVHAFTLRAAKNRPVHWSTHSWREQKLQRCNSIPCSNDNMGAQQPANHPTTRSLRRHCS